MMDLDILTIVTYVCAGLGGLLLLLCILLAFFILYGFCKKYCGRGNHVQRYSVVPTARDPFDLDHAVLQRYHINNDAAKGLSGLMVIDEVDPGIVEADIHGRKSNPGAPVKRKIFWKKKKEERKTSTTIFVTTPDDRIDQDEVEAADGDRPRRFFKKKEQKSSMPSRRKSKSDWYIYSRLRHGGGDARDADDDEDSHQTLLYPYQVISLIGSPVRSDETKQSQYFDALETIREEFDEVDETSGKESLVDKHAVDEKVPPKVVDFDENWTDLSDDSSDNEDPPPPPPSSTPSRRSRNPPKDLSFSVKRRVKALKKLQFENEKLEAKFYRELFYLEAEFHLRKRKKVFDKRSQVINQVDGHGGPTGIENFWLQAMRNTDTLSEIIQIHDVPVLKHLRDVQIISGLPATQRERAELTSEHLDFRIDFHFSPDNPFFENTVLSKEYYLKCEPDPNLPFTFEGPEVVTCRGCKINWNRGKNVTLQPVKRPDKQTGELKIKWAKRNSFFNFFTPPKTVREWLLDPRKSALMEAHFEIGLYFKETFVPKAIIFYANHSILNLGEDDVIPGPSSAKRVIQKPQLVPLTSSNRNKKTTTQIVKRPISSQSHFSSSNGDLSKRNSSITMEQDREDSTSLTNQDTRPRSWYQLMNGNAQPAGASSEAATDTIDSIDAEESSSSTSKPQSQPEVTTTTTVDPIVGRYRLTSSDGFDDFLKALGVGIVKRKLANSISPIIVVLVDSKTGVYTVRTETHVTTAEINFRLDEPFPESTMDGRTTTTTATRVGNIITLNQKGSKGEKDTQVVRDFRGDEMHLTMTVDSVICRRTYQRFAIE